MDEYFEILSKAVGEYVALVPIEQRDEARRWARKYKRFYELANSKIYELYAENQSLCSALDELKRDYNRPEWYTLWETVRIENTRLRELIKSVEWADDYCPWCERKYYKLEHSPSCPAFGDNGILSR